MKRTYKTPKAVLVDFCYDEQVVAESSGLAMHGDPDHIGRCQQSSPESCRVFWNDNYGDACSMQPFALPRLQTFDIL